ncbi:hypothetical protein V6O07_06285, partial [Arthrospira platensis SPKY2]
VSGSNLTWYDAATAGNILPSSTLLVDGVTYYVSQTIGSVESSRTAVTAMFVPRATLFPVSCGATLTSINSNMAFTLVSMAQGYKIYVKNMTTGNTQTVTRVGNDAAARRVRISDFSNAAFSTTFRVWAEITLDGTNFIPVA